MSPRQEISSTERLLHVIREKGSAATSKMESAGSATREAPKTASRNVISLGKFTTVGVDIGFSEVKMVRTRHETDTQWRLIDFRRFPIPQDIRDNKENFSDFLNKTLTDFSVSKKEKIWSTVSFADVEIRHIRIPKVPKKQVVNAIYWTAKKESPFDETTTIFDFVIQGDVTEKGIQKTAVMVYTASKEKVEDRKRLFARSGFPLTGISMASFAIQNLLTTEWISSPQETVATLYIGNDHSRIDIFSYGNLVLTRGIKSGANSMLEALAESHDEREKDVILEMPDGEETRVPVRLEKKPPMDLEQARKVLMSLTPNAPPLTEEDPGFELTEKEVFETILPAVDRLIRQVERTFEHHTLTYGAAVVAKIYISCVLEAYRPIIDYIGDQLGIERDIIDPLGPGNPSLGNVIPPQELHERTAFTMAVGLALSKNPRTPNAIFTYQEKENEKSIRRINWRIFACFLGIMAVCLVAFLWQLWDEDIKNASAARLRKELARYGAGADQNLVLGMAAKAMTRQKGLKEGARRYLGMAVISEVSLRTPPNVRLLNITADLSRPPEAEKKNSGRSIVIEGLISGEREILEVALAQYMIRLEASPLFSEPAVHKSEHESNQKLGEVLHFIVKASLV